MIKNVNVTFQVGCPQKYFENSMNVLSFPPLHQTKPFLLKAQR